MADDEEGGGEEGAPAWMATFADLMSLLLTFFVLLLSFSSMDSRKFMGMSGSIRYAFGVQKDVPGKQVGKTDDMIQVSDSPRSGRQVFQALVKTLERAAGDRGLKDSGIEISVGKDGVRMRLPSDLLFAGGSSELNPKMLPFLNDIARRGRSGFWMINVEGHTDQIKKRGNDFSSSWRLSSDRAISTVDYLITKGKVPRNRLQADAFADTQPVAGNDTPAGRQKNRRVEFLFRPADRKLMEEIDQKQKQK